MFVLCVHSVCVLFYVGLCLNYVRFLLYSGCGMYVSVFYASCLCYVCFLRGFCSVMFVPHPVRWGC